MATKVYKEGYMVIVDPPISEELKYTNATECSFGFDKDPNDNDVAWVRNDVSGQHIYNGLATNITGKLGGTISSVEEARKYLLSFIGDPSDTDVLYAFTLEYGEILSQASIKGYATPSLNQQIIQDGLILDMKSNEIWDEEDLIYIPANDGSEEFGYLNWKDPANFELSKAGTVAWTSNVGFKGDGTTGYMNTGWDRLNNSVNFAAANASVSIYVATAGTNTEFYYGGRESADTNQFHLYRSGTTLVCRANSSSQLSVSAQADATGLLSVIDYISTQSSHFFNDGVKIISSNLTPAHTMIDRDMVIGALDDNGEIKYWSNVEWGYFSIGSGLFDKQSIKTTLISNYMSTI